MIRVSRSWAFVILALSIGFHLACATECKDEGPVEMGPGIEPAQRISELKFDYPQEARKARIEGLVMLKGIVGRNGKVSRITVLRGLSKECDKAAIKAFSEQRFNPARRNGKLISLFYNVTILFRLKDAPLKPASVPPGTVPPGMVLIPGGTFMMGCTEGDKECSDDEKPVHQVTVKAFYMDKTEVTVGAYLSCVMAGKCSLPRPEDYKELCNTTYNDRNDHPINCIFWVDAEIYCKWAEKRLPSEAEWEYTARGGHNEWKYAWGNEQPNCSRAVMMDDERTGCGNNSTWHVGSKGEYGFGLNDMTGNVAEFVEDGYHDNYNAAPTNGQAWVNGGYEKKVTRGGSWGGIPINLRNSFRGEMEPLGWYNPSVGFRCAKSAE